MKSVIISAKIRMIYPAQCLNNLVNGRWSQVGVDPDDGLPQSSLQ